MQVITLESDVVKKIIRKIDIISSFIEESVSEFRMNNYSNDDEKYVDSDTVKKFLGISERTMQRIRTERLIPYSKVRGRAYYKIKDLRAMLEGRIVKTRKGNLEELIKHIRKNAL